MKLFVDRDEKGMWVLEANASSAETNLHESGLVESFCHNGVCVAFLYNALPLQEFLVSVSSPDADKCCSFGASPVFLHCVSGAVHFEVPLRERDLDGRRAFVGTLRLEVGLPNLLCTIGWSDGGNSCGHGGMPYRVGHRGSMHVAGCVEVPIGRNVLDPDVSQPGAVRCISLYRGNEPFWTIPRFHESTGTCPEDTQLLLSEVHRGLSYRAILPLVDPVSGLRTSLFSTGGWLCVRVEAGWIGGLPISRLHGARLAVSAEGPELFPMIRTLFRNCAELLGTFSSRLEKLDDASYISLVDGQPLLSGVNYCTWDAFATRVTPQDVMESVRYFDSLGIRLSSCIVDDGWQGGTGREDGDGPGCWEAPDDPMRPALTSFDANKKFNKSLKGLSNDLAIPVFAWVTIVGYFGGVSRSCGKHVESDYIVGTIGHGLERNNASRGKDAPMVNWKKGFQAVVNGESAIDEFIGSYYSYLRNVHGVTGLKIDGQSILECLCNLNSTSRSPMTRVDLARCYRDALAKSYEQQFGTIANINCMAMSNDVVMMSTRKALASNLVWRASDDHAYPDCDETPGAVIWHILLNGVNNLYLGEIFPFCDADMFRVADAHAELHAILRVASGGPVTISDRTPLEPQRLQAATSLLRSLTTRAGHPLLCEYPGRATCDSIFQDPRDSNSPQIFKIWNRNSINGLIAVFNLTEHSHLIGDFRPSDIEDFRRMSGHSTCAYVSYSTSPCLRSGSRVRAFHASSTDASKIDIEPFSGMCIHMCPVLSCFLGLQLAIIGVEPFLNAGGAISTVTFRHQLLPASGLTRTDLNHARMVEVVVCDGGELVLWLSRQTFQYLLETSASTGPEWKPFQMHVIEALGPGVVLRGSIPNGSTRVGLYFHSESWKGDKTR